MHGMSCMHTEIWRAFSHEQRSGTFEPTRCLTPDSAGIAQGTIRKLLPIARMSFLPPVELDLPAETRRVSREPLEHSMGIRVSCSRLVARKTGPG